MRYGGSGSGALGGTFGGVTPIVPLKIAVMGGSGSSQYGMMDWAWPKRLEHLLNSGGPKDVVVKDFAIGGSTAFQMNTTAVYGTNTAVQETILWRPDIVFISIGCNDAVGVNDGRSLAQIKTDADTLISTLKASLSGVVIIYVSELPYDNANFTSANLKNKGIVTQYFELPSAGILASSWTAEMLETVVSGAMQTKIQNWIDLDVYIKANAAIGANFITGAFWKVMRLGASMPDMGHFNQAGHQWIAASVYKQMKSIASITALFPRLSTQPTPGWVDPDSMFNYYLTASGDGYVRSGTELVTNGAFAADTNWNKFFGVTIAAGVMAFDGVTSMAAGNTFLSPITAIPVTVGQTYFITYTIGGGGTTRDISPQIGGVAGTARNAAGTYTDTITAVDTTGFIFAARTTTGVRTGNIDNVSIVTGNADAPGLNSGDVNRWWGDQVVFSPEEYHLPAKTRVAFWPTNLTVQNNTEPQGALNIMFRGGPPTLPIQLSINGGAFSATADSTDTHGNANSYLYAGVLAVPAGTYTLRLKIGAEVYGPFTLTIQAPILQAQSTTHAANVGFTATAGEVAGARSVVLLNTGVLAGAANMQLPTTAAMFAQIPGAFQGFTFNLRVIHAAASGANAWTVTTNTGITLSGTMTIAANTWRDFLVAFTSPTTAIVQSIGTGTNS